MEVRSGEIIEMRILTARAALLGTAAAAAFFATSAVAQPDAPAPAAKPTSDVPVSNDAQTQAQAATGSDQAIFVTARRRSELLLNVPVAVSAYSGEQLNRQGALTITEVAKTTPNVTLKVSRGTNSTLTPFIRGVGQQDPVAGFEQGVGVYLDDVYFNRPQAAVLDIYDVERIEVLRGPQGTLYGRNTIGGAVKFVTKRIRDDGPHISMRTNIGTHHQADFIVSASTPITTGLMFGVAGARLSNGGFGKNLTTGLSNYNKNILAGRASLELIPSDRIFFRLTGDYIVDDSNPKGGHRLFQNQCTTTTPPQAPTFGCAGSFPILSNVYDTQGGLTDPTQKVTAGGVAFHAEADISDVFKVKSITAYRKDVGYTPIDFDALPFPDVDVPAIYRNKQFSQELQLVVDGSKLQGIVGLYYLNARAFDEFDVRLYTALPTVFPGLTSSTLGNVHTKTWAAFGDLTYNFSPQWAVSLGGRWTNDQRTAYILAQTRINGGQPGLGGSNGFAVGTVLPASLGGTTTNFSGSRTDKAFTPRASISFKPTSDHNIYLSYSRGFKGGGFDPRGKAINAPTQAYNDIYNFLTFKPEKVDSYELGWKAALFDRRLQLATAVFDAEYKDVQIPGSLPCTTGGVANFCGTTTNAGRARLRGVEIETNARLAQGMAMPGDRLTFAGSLGYIDGKYLKFITNVPNPTPPPASNPTDVANTRHIQNTPKWTLSGTLDYDTPAWGGRLDANTTLSYRSFTQQIESSVPYLDQPGYALWDANMVWRSQGNRFELGLHAKNILDKHYIIAGYSYVFVNPITNAPILNSAGVPTAALGKTLVGSAFYGPPREVFLSAAINF
jgi:iron complex outermembrane receptor protein